MKNISEITPFADGLEIISMPAARIIGREVRNGGELGNTAPALWGETYSSGAMDILKALPQLLDNSTYGWTCDAGDGGTFSYIVCVLTPAGTPVPDGFSYRDLSATLCAKGMYGEDVTQTVQRAKALGYDVNWSECGWNAELYLAEEEATPPFQTSEPWRWLVPVKPTE